MGLSSKNLKKKKILRKFVFIVEDGKWQDRQGTSRQKRKGNVVGTSASTVTRIH